MAHRSSASKNSAPSWSRSSTFSRCVSFGSPSIAKISGPLHGRYSWNGARPPSGRAGETHSIAALSPGPMRLLTGPGRPKRFFDRIAARYDGINARLYKREWLDRVRDAVRGERVLAVGVGAWVTTNQLADAVGICPSRERVPRAPYPGP